MTLRFPPEPLPRLLRWAQAAFFAIAIVLIACWASVTASGWMFQKTQGGLLDAARKAAIAPASAVTPKAADIAASPLLVGRLEIERLGVSVIVMEGTGSRTLRRAVGHIPGTALPGRTGNIGLSGHRDTFFRPLRNIRVGDPHRGHDTIEGRLPLPRRIDARCRSARCFCPRFEPDRDSNFGNLLSLLLCRPRSQALYRSG